MTIFKLATIAVGQIEHRFTAAMLDLAGRRLNKPWQITAEQAEAHAVLVDIDQAEGRQYWQAHPDKRKLVAFGTAPANQQDSLWSLQKPLSVDKLADLLGRIEGSSRHAAPPAEHGGETLRPYYPPDSFAAHLHRQLLQGDAVALIARGLPPFYVCPRKHLYYMPSMHINAFTATLRIISTTPLAQLQVQTLQPPALFHAVERHKLQGWALDGLVWTAALYAVSGPGLPTLAPDTRVGLKYWPNFSRLPHQPEHLTLAAFMFKRPLTLAEIAVESKLSLPATVSFCNACLALGLLDSHTEIQPPRPSLPQQTVKLFKQILQTLRRT